MGTTQPWDHILAPALTQQDCRDGEVQAPGLSTCPFTTGQVSLGLSDMPGSCCTSSPSFRKVLSSWLMRFPYFLIPYLDE